MLLEASRGCQGDNPVPLLRIVISEEGYSTSIGMLSVSVLPPSSMTVREIV